MLPQLAYAKEQSVKALEVFVTLHNQLAGQTVTRTVGWEDLLYWSREQTPSSHFTHLYEKPDGQVSFSMQRDGGHRFVFVLNKARTLKLTQCRFDASPMDPMRASKYARMFGELLTLERAA